MSVHGASSPYRTLSRAPSPYGRPVDIPYEAFQSLPTGLAQVGPGAITYTTSTGPDGRTVYHLFKAVAASYPTPNGVINGIQWVPAEATTTLPPGVIPPSDRFGVNDLRSTHDWEREDEKRRKKEEKEARRLRELHTRNNSDYELQLARERDAQPSTTKERRKSFIGGAGSTTGVPFPQPGAPPSHAQAGYGNPITGYASSGGHSRSASVGGVYDISKQMSDLELKGKRERKVSIGHARKYSANHSPYERARTISSGFTANSYPSPSGAYSPYSQPKPYSSASPSVRTAEFTQTYGTASSTGYPASRSPGQPTTTFSHPPGGYPPGHVLYEAPHRARAPSRPVSRAPSRGPSPNHASSISRSASPSYGRSPHGPVSRIPGEPQQLPAPEGFSRPINAANSFAPFEPLKVLDMEGVYDVNVRLPKMPQVLSTHDIRMEDWKRCMQDLTRSWLGQLPVGPEPPRKSKLARDLVELWNVSFFLPRGVELVLFKGKDRRTRSHSGLVHPHLYENDNNSDSSTTSDSSEFERSAFGSYDRQDDTRKRHDDKKKRRRERKRRAKLHSVYLAYVRSSYTSGGPGFSPHAAPISGSSGYPPIAAYGTPQTGYAPPPAAAYVSPYNPTMAIPTTRSRGSGGGY